MCAARSRPRSPSCRPGLGDERRPAACRAGAATSASQRSSSAADLRAAAPRRARGRARGRRRGSPRSHPGVTAMQPILLRRSMRARNPSALRREGAVVSPAHRRPGADHRLWSGQGRPTPARRPPRRRCRAPQPSVALAGSAARTARAGSARVAMHMRMAGMPGGAIDGRRRGRRRLPHAARPTCACAWSLPASGAVPAHARDHALAGGLHALAAVRDARPARPGRG